MSRNDYQKLCAINSHEVHSFVAEAVELCNPDKIFICSDTPDEIAYIRQMAVACGEESAALAIPGHTFHFDGPYDQGRDRAVTKFLVPKWKRWNKLALDWGNYWDNCCNCNPHRSRSSHQ